MDPKHRDIQTKALVSAETVLKSCLEEPISNKARERVEMALWMCKEALNG